MLLVSCCIEYTSPLKLRYYWNIGLELLNMTITAVRFNTAATIITALCTYKNISNKWKNNNYITMSEQFQNPMGKSWNTLTIFAPPSARRNFFKCAPPPNFKSWIRPWCLQKYFHPFIYLEFILQPILGALILGKLRSYFIVYAIKRA
jgi:hypothetical protein